jgi:hypothetical protein
MKVTTRKVRGPEGKGLYAKGAVYMVLVDGVEVGYVYRHTATSATYVGAWRGSHGTWEMDMKTAVARVAASGVSNPYPLDFYDDGEPMVDR